MSYHSYPSSHEGYGSNRDRYKDGPSMHPRDSTGCRSRMSADVPPGRSAAPSSEASPLPQALSFLHSCGLDVDDLQTLAKLPENLITADLLPDLLAEIKNKKDVTSRQSAHQSSKVYPRDDRRHTTLDNPYEMSGHQPYHSNEVQFQSLESRWAAPPMSQSNTSSESNYMFNYNQLNNKSTTYFDESRYGMEPYRQNMSEVSPSYSNYTRDVAPSSHVFHKDYNHSSFQCDGDYLQSPAMPRRDFGPSAGFPGRDHLSGRNADFQTPPSKIGGIPSLLSLRDLGPSSHPPSRITSQSPCLSNTMAGQSSTVPVRSVDQPPNQPRKHVSQPSIQPSSRKFHKLPTKREASDFYGVTPEVFPYACILCDITVLSNRDWNSHTSGAQHAKSQLSLVEKHPLWNQSISCTRHEHSSETRRSRTPPRKRHSSVSSTSVRKAPSISTTSSKSKTLSSKSSTKSTDSRDVEDTQDNVVCVKFELDQMEEAFLRSLFRQFGPIIQIRLLSRMAFVEMMFKRQAMEVVKYYQQNPLRVKGTPFEFSLVSASPKNSTVVCFSGLPTEGGVFSELLATAELFGTVQHSLFLPDECYFELSTKQEAMDLLEHFTKKSLTLHGKTITVSLSEDYVPDRKSETDPGKATEPKSHSNNRKRKRSNSPARKSRIPEKKRSQEEKSKSNRSHDSKKQDRQRSVEKSKESCKQESLSKNSFQKKSPSKEDSPSEKDVEIKAESDISDDSDLEGLAVIADDGEELNTEDEFTEVEDDELLDTLTEQIQQQSDYMDVEIESNEQLASSDVNLLKALQTTALSNDSATVQETLSTKEKSEDNLDGFLILDEVKDISTEKGIESFTTNIIDMVKAKGKKQGGKRLMVALSKKCDGTFDSSAKEDDGKNYSENESDLNVTTEAAEKTAGSIKMESSEDFPVSETKRNTSTDPKEPNTELYGRVIEVDGFPVAKKYSEADLLDIGQKYGDVVRVCLLRKNRKVEKALIEMGNATDAANLEAESKKQNIKLGAKTLKMNVSKKYFQVSERAGDKDSDVKELEKPVASCEDAAAVNMDSVPQASSDEQRHDTGRSPVSEENTSQMITEDYGSLTLDHPSPDVPPVQDTAQDETQNAPDGDKVVAVEVNKENTNGGETPITSTSQVELNERQLLKKPSNSSIKTSTESKIDDGVPKQTSVQTSVDAKNLSDENRDVRSTGAVTPDHKSENVLESSDSVSEVQTPVYEPIGTEFVGPVVGYLCSLCNQIFASEIEGKNDHCRTPLHHQKLKEHMERTNLA